MTTAPPAARRVATPSTAVRRVKLRLRSMAVGCGRSTFGSPCDHRRMATLRAVVEIGPEAVEGAAWPVEFADTYRWEALNASTTPATVGTVMAALAEWCRPEDTRTGHDADRRRGTPLDRRSGLPGHPRRHPTHRRQGNHREPRLLRRPRRLAILAAHLARPRPHSLDRTSSRRPLIHQEKTSQNSAKIPAGALPALLADLREDLIAFLAAAKTWITNTTADPDLAAAVIANIDRHAAITAPLAD